MTTYVAFLRAINLGATRKFPKDALAAATEAAGFDGVATHINTGNVRIETRMRSRARIEAALEKAYAEDRGFEVTTVVFGQEELRSILADADDIQAQVPAYAGVHYVSLLKQQPVAAAARKLEARSSDRERVVVRGRAVHLLPGDGLMNSTVAGVVEKHLGPATARNLRVIRAIVEKWC